MEEILSRLKKDCGEKIRDGVKHAISWMRPGEFERRISFCTSLRMNDSVSAQSCQIPASLVLRVHFHSRVTEKAVVRDSCTHSERCQSM